MGVVTEKDIAVAVARQFGFRPVRDFARFNFPEGLLRLVDADTALQSLIFPLKLVERTLHLAMVNPLDVEIIDNLSFRNRLRVIPCVTTPSEIHAAVNRHYLNAGEGDMAAPAQACWTVLVVEDQEMARASISAALQKEGYEVIQATNGREGLTATWQHRPQLIIADTVMPQMDGYEMFRALQGNAATRDIPVIALSSRATAEEEARLLGQGYFDFIAKPINLVRVAARAKLALRIAYPVARADRHGGQAGTEGPGVQKGSKAQ
jgi:CheY-like chemotaxis protein